ncbi:MAG: alpha/beta fold hydrolase [Pyrinomonadaceae bacterium]
MFVSKARTEKPSAAGPWLVTAKPAPEASLRLVCFPYAGGAAGTFHAWPRRLPEKVELCAVQLPGRGIRMSEPPFTHLSPLVASLARVIEPHLDKPAAFFGHSMGALIAFELARQLRRESKREPVHLFLSGRRAAQLATDEPPSYDLPEPEFLDTLRELNGTPKEVFEHPELLQLMIPLLRADFGICQTYTYTPEPPLRCPITVFGGLKDEQVGSEVLGAWAEQTTSSFSLHMLPGDHFFINSSQSLICHLLSQQLSRLI